MFSAARTIWQSLSDGSWSLPAGGGHGDDSSTGTDDGDDYDYDDDDKDNGDAQSYGGFYEPSFADVLVAKAMLQRAGHLPLELVDDIVDYAEYWPHTHAEADYAQETGNGLVIPPRSFRNDGNNKFLLRTLPLGFRRPPVPGGRDASGEEDESNAYSTTEPEPRPCHNVGGNDSGDGNEANGGVLCSDDDVRTWFPAGQAPPLEYPCRKIVFTLTSHDQGWANNQRDRGTYKGSYSWFDVGLERYGVPAGGTSETSNDGQKSQTTPAMPATASLYTLRPDVVEAPAQNGDPQPASAADPPDQKRYQFSFPLLPGVDRLQSNVVATRAWTEHKIVWSWTDGMEDADADADADANGPASAAQNSEGPPASTDSNMANAATTTAANGPPTEDNVDLTDGLDNVHPLEKLGRGAETGDGAFVRNLRVGDVVTLWAKARFPGWVNIVQRAQIDVYWAV
ncbi:hypothetical protein SPBR_04257 [Sporothrix brasiliensis 5110]|uniref:Uncharacterized protein n=1 Tax=Sporothrix brasiliensis 5110 TaxID=1398154 RepID=A0A0C2J9X9_9PEZI|nr:uncharacterized protein SPBR_04257 [Sporothrix brasiliensis 5110]KIH93717.1 hypothetical protein SPBR_04257 [Sporothrix brasiliensis 5110]